MMELTCAFILISASLVLASPHGYGGYGVKGGASARAESSASAGAFGSVGEIPLPVPLGAGYSGSFSKSSSSNSASSSASSSSSSFSYTGAVAGGFGLNGGTPGHGGCSSGNCQTAGGNGTPVPHGSSAYGYNTANSTASAGAGVVSGSGCPGLNCDGVFGDYGDEKCTSGQCKPKPQTGTTSIDSDSNKCTAGQCGSALENGATPTTDYGSNDIRAVKESSDSAHNTKDQSSSIDKASSAYDGAGTDCSQGKCDSSGPHNSNSNYHGHNSDNYYQGSSGSNKQQASFDTGITSHYQKPSTHLETPKLDSKCNSGNCNAGPGEPGHKIPSSSYNVPIHGSYDKSELKPKCDGVKCENQPNRPYSPIDNTVTARPSSFDFPSSTNCAGSNCFGIPSSQVTGGPSLTVRPGNVNFGHPPSHVPTLSVPSCNSPNCSPGPTNPTITAGSNPAPGHIGHGNYGKPSDVSNDKLPAYTGGFGGPAGILNPNEYNFPAPTGNPSHGHASTPQNTKPLGSAQTGCNSPSCSVYPSTPGSTGGPVPTGTYNHKPDGEVPNKKPTYTGGFGGPTGTLKPNEFDIHAAVTNKPNYAHSGSPSYNIQSPAGNNGTPSCKAGGNCGGYSPSAGAAPSFGGPAGVLNPNEYNIPTPIGNPSLGNPSLGNPSHGHASTPQNNIPLGSAQTGCNSPSCSVYPSTPGSTGAPVPTGTYNDKPDGEVLNEKPTYTGGFGGPAGTLKPHEFDIHAAVMNKPNYAHPGSPSNNIQSPAGNNGTPGCKAGGNCGEYSPSAGAAPGAMAPSGYYGATKPNTFNNSPNDKLPTYTGGFGGPGGVFNPDKHDIHATDFSSPNHTPSGTYYNPTSSGHPGGCKTPNCYPSLGSTAAANAQAESLGITKPSLGPHSSSVTLPAYPSGYNTPSGVHGQDEISGPTSIPSFTHNQSPSSPGNYMSGCKTGNCATYPSSGPSASANAQPGSFGTTKPTDISSAAPIHPQYMGGFSGPSGSFNPNEHTYYYVTPSIGNAPTNCRTPNCVGSSEATADAISGANAHLDSYGITKPSGGNNPSDEKPIYSGGFGGASGLLKPNENTIPSVSPAPNNKPTGTSTPAACTSGNCNLHVAPVSAIHSHNGASNGAHATAAAAAEAHAVAYTGGFGGPPGVLTPYDDGKIGALPTYSGQAQGPQIGGAHGSYNTNTHSQHGTNSGANSGLSGPAGLAGAYGNTGAQVGSIAGSVAHAGAAAGASAGTPGYNPYGSQYNHAGSIKGNPCGSGCGGSSGGAHSGSGGSGLDISGGHSFPKLGYSDGLSGGGSTSGAAAKSLTGANAFGVGGGYASSSATAHASAGAYTKGGYGKR